MTTFTRFSLPVVSALMLLAGCAHTRPDGPRLSTSEAVRLAKEAAVRGGFSLSHYKRPEARYLEDKTWWVFFDGRGFFFRRVGNHFAVYIDDQTGASRIVPGM